MKYCNATNAPALPTLFFTTNEIEIMFSFGLFLVHFTVSSIDIAFSLCMVQQQHYEALMSDMTSYRAE